MGTTAATVAVAYRSLWHAAWPLVRWYVRRKDARRLVPASVTRERFGHSHRPRSWDAGSAWVLWIHGASVGECLSVLPVVEFALSPRCGSVASAPEDRRVVVTTTTPAARHLLQQRLNEIEGIGGRAVCVFAPLDAPASVARFYDVWRPHAGLWVESELWPTLIREASHRRIPIGLLNARISPTSLRWWSLPLLRVFIRDVVGRFSLVVCQDATNQSRYRYLGALAPRVATNLKFASPWRASDASLLAALEQSIRSRKTWLAVSTHENEELLLAGVHAELQTPGLLSVITPRHPERTATIVQQIQHKYPALRIALRSIDTVPTPETDVFIVDTLGETGLFFDAIATVVMGGTFVRRGGHNPIEPLRAGCDVAVGPHAFNFTDIIEQLQHHRCPLTKVATTTELTQWLRAKLDDSSTDSGRRMATQALMKTLSVQAMSTYENALVEWLVANNEKGAKTID